MIETNKKYTFDGPFATYCSMYVEYKIGLGYKFQVSSYYSSFAVEYPGLTLAVIETSYK
ncbi:hypothetical protein IRB23M11_23220 [Alkalibacterium sp. m-11]|uniref:Uncharacterized protein n=1 Tax=Alkalibacterium indicireducens TaxID=398758 RepID=A0ABP3K9R3_9LACT